MAGDCKICNCIGELLIAVAAAEAMEHNAVVSKKVLSIGVNAKRLLSEDEYDKLSFEHDWLEIPITEPFAGLAFHVAMGGIREKCGVESENVDSLKKLFDEAKKDVDARRFRDAQGKFIGIKTQIMDIAEELCRNQKEG